MGPWILFSQMKWRQNSCYESAFNSFFQLILRQNFCFIHCKDGALNSFSKMISTQNFCFIHCNKKAFNFFSKWYEDKTLASFNAMKQLSIIFSQIIWRQNCCFILHLGSLLLQSGRGVMERLTRPLHVPYSIGLPYSYTIPSCTRPTSTTTRSTQTTPATLTTRGR